MRFQGLPNSGSIKKSWKYSLVDAILNFTGIQPV